MMKNHADRFNDRKINVGMSVYGITPISRRETQKFLITEKKALRSSGHSVRVVPNKADALNSAQAFHNKLTAEHNLEIVLIKAKDSYWFGRTVAVQDIEGLAARDQKRPKTDAKVGMLPPKLALTLLNLATPSSSTSSGARQIEEDPSSATSRTNTYGEASNARSDKDMSAKDGGVRSSALQQADMTSVVLDPFCGTGVVLQEAMLTGHDVYGTDIEPRMIEYTEANLSWLKNEKGISNYISLEIGDARNHRWEKPFDSVVCETYLGPPLSNEPSPNHLSDIKKEVNDLLSMFLKNLAFQTEKGMTTCIGVPAWFVRGKYTHLKLLDDLEKLGYTRRVLKHASNEELIYRRPKQIVARELLILERT
jgi:tRNA G10  N-methylase Trm11